MKSTDLMLGDWVTILRSRENGSDRNVRINGIGKDCILAPGMYQNETGCYPYDYEHIVPVPLTAEILEKNGFVQDDAYTDAIADGCFAEFLVWHYYANEVIVSYDNSEELVISNNVGYPCSEITLYRPKVHELQHALRLCRLDELADNFEI